VGRGSLRHASAAMPSQDGPSASGAFEPIQMFEVELGRALGAAAVRDGAGERRYRRSRALVRLHTQPLGLVDFHGDTTTMDATEYARGIWEALGPSIVRHLQRDGLKTVTELGAAGLPWPVHPPCVAQREALLAAAPPVSVVVCTRDRPDRVATCLRSLVAVEYPSFEVVVVDNAPSSSATADYIRATYGSDRRVRYVREDRRGVVWARNRGLMASEGEIVAYADDDVLVDRYWLVELVKGFQVADRVACVTGLVLPAELETQAQAWFEEYGGFAKGFDQRAYDMRQNRPKTPLYPYTAGKFGSTNSTAFSTSILRDVGGFDKALCVAGAEDISTYFQLIMDGYTLVYEPNSIVYHYHRREYSALKRQMYWYGIGLTAYLTKCLVDRPKDVPHFLARLPMGLIYMFSARSPKNVKKSHMYPRELTNLEIQGTLVGPFAYLQGRWRARKLARLGDPRRSSQTLPRGPVPQ